MKIYYIEHNDDVWGDTGVIDDKFYAFHTHAQAKADELNAAERKRHEERDAHYKAKWEKANAVVEEIKEKTGIDITPLLPQYHSEWKPAFEFLPTFIVREAEVQ